MNSYWINDFETPPCKTCAVSYQQKFESDYRYCRERLQDASDVYEDDNQLRPNTERDSQPEDVKQFFWYWEEKESIKFTCPPSSTIWRTNLEAARSVEFVAASLPRLRDANCHHVCGEQQPVIKTKLLEG